MKRILLLDEKNYNGIEEEIFREACRGIICKDGLFFFVESNFNELKLPGGGREKNETLEECLIREVLEETGRHVIRDSIKEFGYIEEKRKSTHEEAIWHQINYLFFCDVDDIVDETSFSENEKKYQMHFVIYSIDEAIKINKMMLEKEGEQPWNSREYKTLILLKDYLQKKKLRDSFKKSRNYIT